MNILRNIIIFTILILSSTLITLSEESAIELVKKGNILYNEGKVEEALDCYKRALEIEPNYVYGWYSRGLTLLSCKRYEECLYCFEKVVELNPSHELSWFNRGFAL